MKAIFVVMNTTWAVVKIRPEKNSGQCGIWTHDLYDTGAVKTVYCCAVEDYVIDQNIIFLILTPKMIRMNYLDKL